MRQQVAFAAACAAVLLTAVAPAQGRQKSAADQDAAALRAYRMTPATLQKVSAAVHTFAQAMQNDPTYKSAMAASQELEALQDKDERTEAENHRVAVLEKQVEDAEKEFQALSGSSDADEGSATLADMARNIARVPHMADALKSAGLSPRELATFEMAMLQAGFAAGFKKAGMLKELPPGVSPENVQFVLDHEAEIKQIQQEMSGGMGGKPDGR
jgi:chaperonin cofactor prefoldin